MTYCNMYCMCLIVTCTACASLKHTTWMLPRCTILYVRSTSFLSYFVYLTSLMYCIKFVSFLCSLLYWSNVISFFFHSEREKETERERERKERETQRETERKERETQRKGEGERGGRRERDRLICFLQDIWCLYHYLYVYVFTI